jgi:hypothetical protein
MANSPNVKPTRSTYGVESGMTDDTLMPRERVIPTATPTTGGSSTAIIVLLALAVLGVLAYYMMSGTSVDNGTATAPAAQQTQPVEPAPTDPPPAPVTDPPQPNTPAPATVPPAAPAPAAPAN